MTRRPTWRTTTHKWAWEVDPGHLASMRDVLLGPGAAGGRRHLMMEVLAYARDEAVAAARPGHVLVTYHDDRSVTIDDDGRGTDTRVDDNGRVIRKPVMATADIRFTDPRRSPRLPDGLARRGMSSVAALSDLLIHENHRGTEAWTQTYHYGIPAAELMPVTPRGHSGTVVTFHAEIDGPERLTPEDLRAFPGIHIEVQ